MAVSLIERVSVVGLCVLTISACTQPEPISYICWVDHTRGVWVGSKYTPPGVEVCAPIKVSQLPRTAIVTSTSGDGSPRQIGAAPPGAPLQPKRTVISNGAFAEGGRAGAYERFSDGSQSTALAEPNTALATETNRHGNTNTASAMDGRAEANGRGAEDIINQTFQDLGLR